MGHIALCSIATCASGCGDSGTGMLICSKERRNPRQIHVIQLILIFFDPIQFYLLSNFRHNPVCHLPPRTFKQHDIILFTDYLQSTIDDIDLDENTVILIFTPLLDLQLCRRRSYSQLQLSLGTRMLVSLQ